MRSGAAAQHVAVLFGTRPEAVKLAPVVRALRERFRVTCICSGQHTDLLRPFVESLQIAVDIELAIGRPDQTAVGILHRTLAALEPLLARDRPDALLVQGDTTTALAGALAAFHARVPIGHVEAGLRSGDAYSPFPEEMNRRLISRMASIHFVATEHNVRSLRREGIDGASIVRTGNPVVDSLTWALAEHDASARIRQLFEQTEGRKVVAVTTHRRESFGPVMAARLRVLRAFTERHHDVCIVLPVHPNPNVVGRVREELSGASRVLLIEPLGYLDFIHLLARSWLIVSDSGGVQEEAPTLGKPVLVIRENTERPEAIEAGVARLVGRSADSLERMLEEVYADPAWIESVTTVANPYGEPGASNRIAAALGRFLERSLEA